MADLYETTTPSPPANPPPPHEPEDISSFLHHLLHSSSSSPASYIPFKTKPMHAFSSAPPLMSPAPGATGTVAPPEDLGFHRFDGSGLGCRFRDGNRVESSSGLHLSDPGVYFPAHVKEGTENLFSSLGGMDSDPNASPRRRGFSAENDLGDFSCDSEGTGGASDVNLNPVPSSRPSSKRTRAAEVHNLSEKRRRSRINEKMKALQNLIPNSNKTDKASMLDEAIEYLKQLQLQVQMLSMRNGISLHPMCLPGVLESVQLSQLGMAFDEGNGLLNSNREAGPFSANHESSMQAAIGVSNQTDIPSSDTPFGFEHAPFNIPKEMCKEVILPQQKLEISASGNNSPSSASGVS